MALRKRRHAALVTETMRLWLQRRCGSGYRDDADCGRRYLDIKTKGRWGYIKTGTPVSCELRSGIAGNESSRVRSRTKWFGTVRELSEQFLIDGCDTLFIHV